MRADYLRKQNKRMEPILLQALVSAWFTCNLHASQIIIESSSSVNDFSRNQLHFHAPIDEREGLAALQIQIPEKFQVAHKDRHLPPQTFCPQNLREAGI